MGGSELYVPAVLLLISFGLLLFARRGRRINDHPLCRKCGFDQTGRPTDTFRCAECGTDVSRPRSIRIGHRKPYRRVAATTGVLTLALGTWFGVIAYGQLRGVDWNRHKPAAWLLRETASRDTPTRDAALAEFVRRIDKDLLDAETESRLVETALARQADWSIAWVNGWGTIVEAVDARGRLSAERKTRYRLQSITLVPSATTRLQDQYLTLMIDRTPARFSAVPPRYHSILDPVGLIYAEPTVLIDGKPTDAADDVAHPWAGQSGAYRADHHYMPVDPDLVSICQIPTTPDNPTVEITLDTDRLRREGFSQGSHTLRATFVLRHWSVTYPKGYVEAPAWGKMQLERRVSMDIAFDMPAPRAEMDHSASAEAVRSAITVSEVRAGNGEMMSDRLWVRIGVNRSPVNVAFNVWVFIDSWTTSRPQMVILRCGRGETIAERDYEFVLSKPIAAKSAGKVRVIFEPDRDQKQLNPVWGYRVEFELEAAPSGQGQLSDQ